MSYQYPPPPSSSTDFKLSPRSIGNFQIPPSIPPELSQQVLDSNLFSQELNQPASDQEGQLKRSSSTSNIRDQAVTDAALAASAEKRRNKLGYHRTSVACGHCRRRKIRCILAPADLQNRCANCIRLKKECTFYPVDQPPQPESKGQRGAPSGRGIGRASSSASPTNQLGRPLESQNGLSYPNMAMPPYLGSSDIKRLKDDGFAPENRGLLFGAQNEYQPNTAAWMQSKLPPSTRPVADASAYWRVNTQDPLNPAYPIFPQTLNSSQQQNWSPGAVDPGARDDLNWGVPQRSVSFGHLENLPQAPYQEAFTNRTSPPDAKPYMHGIPTGDPNSIAVSGSTIGSSHIADPRQLPSSSAPQPWQSVPQYGYMKTSAAPAAEAFNSWFPNNPNMPLNPQAGGDSMSYDSVYYNDTAQAGRQQ
ncbi:hypothetical protein V497_04493 [Pseudogymnoascus sp. VKM F-4516 (FW-969)]|nr:hypothetical protein V497_04493 [Pseudogymnoascus sp. VKM F-4516 (FW-969)]